MALCCSGLIMSLIDMVDAADLTSECETQGAEPSADSAGWMPDAVTSGTAELKGFDVLSVGIIETLWQSIACIARRGDAVSERVKALASNSKQKFRAINSSWAPLSHIYLWIHLVSMARSAMDIYATFLPITGGCYLSIVEPGGTRKILTYPRRLRSSRKSSLTTYEHPRNVRDNLFIFDRKWATNDWYAPPLLCLASKFIFFQRQRERLHQSRFHITWNPSRVIPNNYSHVALLSVLLSATGFINSRCYSVWTLPFQGPQVRKGWRYLHPQSARWRRYSQFDLRVQAWVLRRVGLYRLFESHTPF